jgi:NAD(P)H-hydrate epimerase
VLDRVLRAWRGPTLIDADALTRFENDSSRLAAALGGRPAILTPHVVEFSRVAAVARDAVEPQRFEIGAELAKRVGATVLLKGVPTVVTSPAGERLVSATGTPTLGAGGSGDILSGIAGTLLAQIGDPLVAAGLAAFAHGRAAERVVTVGGTRGATLDDVVGELRGVWDFEAEPLRYPVLAELPAVR